jgi:hypothetical protein
VNANDLSGLVRKKKANPLAAATNGAAAASSNGKRKLDEVVGSDQEGKKAKLEG